MCGHTQGEEWRCSVEKQLPVWGHKKNLWRLPGGVFGFRGLWFVDFFVDFLVVWNVFFCFFDEDEGLKLSNIHECFAVK